MLSIERQEVILDEVKQKGKVSISYLSKILKTSLNTIRSDVSFLEKKGIIIRVHGGISLPISNINAPQNEIGIRYLKNIREKRLMAKLVVQEILKKDQVTLFMDSSTSVMLVAEELAQISIKCTIITHFVNIAQILNGYNRTVMILCGGEWWGNENCTIGITTIHEIEKYQVDIALIGCSAIDLDYSVTNSVIETIPVKQAMIKNAEKTWILSDSSKFDKKALMKISNLDQIDAIFTDKAPSSEWFLRSEEHNFRIFFPAN